MERARKILIVDDDQNMRIALFETMSRGGYEASVAESGRMALEMVRRAPPDMVITDIGMPEMDGISLLGKIRQGWPHLPVLVITGHASIETAVAAMKGGACDYLVKPFSLDIIEDSVKRSFNGCAAVVPGANCEGRRRDKKRPLIGEDPKLALLMDRARTVAKSKATVLILGESGTGKEVFARYIHQHSDRVKGPFVALNCAALPDTLLESELFGHEKGAFTGAVTSKKGKFELASGGILLLDEIGEIPLHMQAKLLRVLQEEEVDRLGGKSPIRVDVHVLATTNRSLETAVSEGNFREDLYYRLNVVPLRLPSLKERPGDIMLLADHFIAKYSRQYNRVEKQMSPEARRRFLAYKWPGNVREMENLVERAVLLSNGEKLEVHDFWVDEAVPVAVVSSVVGTERRMAAALPPDVTTLKEMERQMILHALQKTDNNRTRAAKILGVSVRTLRNKLHEYRQHGLAD